MSSPQLENGYTKIANELLEALCRIRISGEARQVLDFIMRKTYGFNKKNDPIALSQFCLGTGMSKPRVCQAITKLVVMNVITKKGNDVANVYSINKDFDTWKPLPKKVTLPKKEMTITKKGKNRYQKTDIQKKLTKETITKEIATTSVADKNANKFNPLGAEIIKAFEDVDPKNKTYYNNKTQRMACDFLISEYGFDEVLKRISVLSKTNKINYFPVINSPNDLKEKWVKLQDAVEKKRAEKINKNQPNYIL